MFCFQSNSKPQSDSTLSIYLSIYLLANLHFKYNHNSNFIVIIMKTRAAPNFARMRHQRHGKLRSSGNVIVVAANNNNNNNYDDDDASI